MKLFPEKIYHELFEIGVTLKAIDSSIEIVLGFALFFVSHQTISDVFSSFWETKLRISRLQ